MTTADEVTGTKEQIRYGNFRKPGWPGLFKTSPGESAVVGLSTFLLVPLMFFKLWWPMLALAAFVLLVEILLVWPSRKGSRAHRLARRRAFSAARRRGRPRWCRALRVAPRMVGPGCRVWLHRRCCTSGRRTSATRSG